MLIKNGTLSTTPLAELLVALADDNFSGAVVFEDENRKKSALSVVDGSVGKVRLSDNSELLGQLLVDMGLTTNQLILEALQANPGPLGQALLAHGLSKEDLDAALKEQVLKRLEHLAQIAGETVFGLYPNRDYLESWGGPPMPVDPLTTIWRTARFLPKTFTARIVAQLGEETLRLHRHSRVGRFGFSPRERTVLDVLRAKPQPYSSLLATGLLEASLLEKVVYTLFSTRHLDRPDAGLPLGITTSELGPPAAATEPGSPWSAQRALQPTSSSAGSTANRPQSSPSPSDRPSANSSSDQLRAVRQSPAELAKLQAEIDAFEAKASTLSYYELLGASPETDVTTISAAFFQLAKKWHPDRLPPELADRRDAVNKIFSRISEAHRTLSNSAQRAEYDRRRAEGDSEEDQKQVEQVLRALTAFQKAEVLVRREDWEGAERLAAEARDGDPEQVEYAALHAWILAKDGKRTAEQGFDDLLATLDRAVTAAPKNLRIKLYRAEVLQRAGREADAMRDYRKLVEAEPQNVAAQRELRLYKMRSQSETHHPKAEGKGILGRIFRKS